jgi:hypothetical protein
MQTKVKGRLVVEKRRGCLQVRSEGLCGAVEACVYTDFQLIQQLLVCLKEADSGFVVVLADSHDVGWDGRAQEVHRVLLCRG